MAHIFHLEKDCGKIIQISFHFCDHLNNSLESCSHKAGMIFLLPYGQRRGVMV